MVGKHRGTFTNTVSAILIVRRYSWAFLEPVDVVGLGLDNYLTVIEQPMDLGTVRTTLENGGYATQVCACVRVCAPAFVCLPVV